MSLSDEVKKNIVVAFSCLQVIVTSAILYGWPALLVVLKDEGQYDEVCPDTSSSLSSYESEGVTNRGVAKCPEQEVRLNLIFTLGSIASAVSCCSGIVFDYVGPRIGIAIGGLVCIISLSNPFHSVILDCVICFS